MRATITFAMLVLAVIVGFLTVAVAQTAAPVYQAAPQQPPIRTTPAPRPPAVAAPFGGLYNTLTGAHPSPRCPAPLTPFNATSCR